MAGLEPNWVSEIPGKLGDRKTPLGKLNWIFTAITDTIAWNSLPSNVFQHLFRQDLLVASLFRNFLLADRILRGLGCSPVSEPRLPPTSEHPLWLMWDSAAESCLQQFSSIYRVRKSGGLQLVRLYYVMRERVVTRSILLYVLSELALWCCGGIYGCNNLTFPSFFCSSITYYPSFSFELGND